MNPEVKAMWVAALRSGIYAQAREQLKSSTGYCCLGVLCDISGLGHWDGMYYVVGEDARSHILPFEVTKWAGLRDDCANGELGWGPVEDNDNGTPFPKIADLIEANL